MRVGGVVVICFPVGKPFARLYRNEVIEGFLTADPSVFNFGCILNLIAVVTVGQYIAVDLVNMIFLFIDAEEKHHDSLQKQNSQKSIHSDMIVFFRLKIQQHDLLQSAKHFLYCIIDSHCFQLHYTIKELCRI